MRIVIDLGAWWHSIRRAWTRRAGSKGEGRCADCNARLTADERNYYVIHCERCEGIFASLWNEEAADRMRRAHGVGVLDDQTVSREPPMGPSEG